VAGLIVSLATFQALKASNLPRIDGDLVGCK
jgi:hypothetical protein